MTSVAYFDHEDPNSQEDGIMVKRLGLEEARALVDAMLKAASENGFIMSAAVVDFGGDLIHLARMDGASAVTARMCYNKAYTAVKWQRDTNAS